MQRTQRSNYTRRVQIVFVGEDVKDSTITREVRPKAEVRHGMEAARMVLTHLAVTGQLTSSACQRLASCDS